MAKKKEIKIPNKKTMNLYQPDFRNDPKREIAIGIVLVVAVIVGLGKYLVIDPYLNNMNYEAENTNLQSELNDMQTKMLKYNETKENYYRYTDAYASEEKLVDRILIIKTIDELAGESVVTSNVGIVANSVSMQVKANSLEAIKEYKNALESSEFIDEVYIANASKSTSEEVIASVSFTCVAKEAK